MFRKFFPSFLLLLIAGCSVYFFLKREHGRPHPKPISPKVEKSTNGREGIKEIPAYVLDVYHYVQTHHQAPEGYVGGRIFQNREHQLPSQDEVGNRILYKEWDVHRHEKGKNRGPERLITGEAEQAYYTADHYRTFQPIKE